MIKECNRSSQSDGAIYLLLALRFLVGQRQDLL